MDRRKTVHGTLACMFFLCVVLHPGNASAGKPDWIAGTSQKYPKAQFLSGVGVGRTRRAAEDMAYGAISRIFHVEISQKTQEWEKYLQEDIGQKTRTRRTVTIEQMTAVSTRKVLENITVAEAWEDEKHQKVYVLAVMDRAHTSRIFLDRVASLDTRVENILKEAEGEGDKIQKVRSLREGLKMLLLREVYNTELRIVNRSGAGIPPKVSLLVITRELHRVLKEELNISVEMTGPEHVQIRAALLEGLTQRGFSVIGTGGNMSDFEALEDGIQTEDVLIKGAITLQPARIQNASFQFIRWNARFELIDKKTGKVFGSLDQSGREGHLSLPEAKRRAVRALQKEMNEALTARLAGFIFGEEK